MYKILHIEQSKFFSNIIKDIFMEKGFQYIFTDDFKEGLNILKNEKIDLVVTSFFAKSLSLEKFLIELGLDFKGANKIPVFLVTSNEMKEELRDIINLGITEYIHKDTVEEEFEKHVEVVMREKLYLEKLKKVSIAVLDDSSLELRVIEDILKRYGIGNVDYYKNGKKLMESGKNYNIYLVDIILQNEFGKDYIRTIRRSNIDASIIAVTMLDNKDLLSELLDGGADDIITKPIYEKMFISKLKTHVRLQEKNI